MGRCLNITKGLTRTLRQREREREETQVRKRCKREENRRGKRGGTVIGSMVNISKSINVGVGQKTDGFLWLLSFQLPRIPRLHQSPVETPYTPRVRLSTKLHYPEIRLSRSESIFMTQFSQRRFFFFFFPK